MNAQSLGAALFLLLGAPGNLPAQPAGIKGGGLVRVGDEALTFSAASLNLATPHATARGARAFLLKGVLKSEGAPMEIELTGLQAGKIYMLKLRRKTPEGLDVWAATLKTEMKILTFEPHLGGMLRLKLSGPLTGAVAGREVHTTWDGVVWATFSSVPKP